MKNEPERQAMNDIYQQFEALAGSNPDEAWNIAYRAGQQNPEPVQFVPMDRLRETVLGMLMIGKRSW